MYKSHKINPPKINTVPKNQELQRKEFLSKIDERTGRLPSCLKQHQGSCKNIWHVLSTPGQYCGAAVRTVKNARMFKPGSQQRSFCAEYTCSPCGCVGFLPGLWFPSTAQSHADKVIWILQITHRCEFKCQQFVSVSAL